MCAKGPKEVGEQGQSDAVEIASAGEGRRVESEQSCLRRWRHFVTPQQPILTQTSSLMPLDPQGSVTVRPDLEKKEGTGQNQADCATGAISFTPQQPILSQTSSFISLNIPALLNPARPLRSQRAQRAVPSVCPDALFTLPAAAEQVHAPLGLSISFDGILTP